VAVTPALCESVPKPPAVAGAVASGNFASLLALSTSRQPAFQSRCHKRTIATAQTLPMRHQPAVI
jgi:hypothetical protein